MKGHGCPLNADGSPSCGLVWCDHCAVCRQPYAPKPNVPYCRLISYDRAAKRGTYACIACAQKKKALPVQLELSL